MTETATGVRHTTADGGSGLDRATLVIAGVVVLGSIMSILDATIVNVAINTLGRDFKTSLATIQWVSTGYMLALSVVIPLTGWGVERFSARRLWLVSVALFVAGSALCGAAWSVGSLIAFRVLQGLGGGMIMPVGQTILAQAAGPKRIGRVMSIVGVPMLLGPVLGPVIGGLLVDNTSWRWIFYVNIPVGAIALPLGARLLPRGGTEGRHPLDVRGLALLSPGLALLVYGLSEASSGGGLTGTRTLVGFISGAVLIALFGLHALSRRGDALIDLRLFRDRGFAAACGTTFAFGVGIFGTMLLLPLYYQIVRGEDALHAGLLLAPQGLGAGMAMPLAGRLTDRLGARPIVVTGLALTLAGLMGYTTIGAHSPYAVLGLCVWVMGLGFGTTMMPAMAAAYGTMERRDVARATTSLNIIQRVGGAFGTALLAVTLDRAIRSDIPAAASSGGSLSSIAGLPAAARSAVVDPLAHAFASTYRVGFAVSTLAFIPALMLPRVVRAARHARAAPAAGATETPADMPAVGLVEVD